MRPLVRSRTAIRFSRGGAAGLWSCAAARNLADYSDLGNILESVVVNYITLLDTDRDVRH